MTKESQLNGAKKATIEVHAHYIMHYSNNDKLVGRDQSTVTKYLVSLKRFKYLGDLKGSHFKENNTNIKLNNTT